MQSQEASKVQQVDSLGTANGVNVHDLHPLQSFQVPLPQIIQQVALLILTTKHKDLQEKIQETSVWQSLITLRPLPCNAQKCNERDVLMDLPCSVELL